MFINKSVHIENSHSKLETFKKGKLRNNSYRLGIVGPGGPLHFALLNIKGEVFNTDVTGALVDPMGQPYDITITLNYDIGVNYSRTVTRIGTENENNITGCIIERNHQKCQWYFAKHDLRCAAGTWGGAMCSSKL